MNDIFISYKVHNRKKAIEYYKALKRQCYQVWFDQLVPKGADWKKTIVEQIKNSKIVICLLSKACLLDDWVLFQIKTARKYGKEILYVTLDNTSWEEHKEYKVKKNIYQNLKEIPLKTFFPSQEKQKMKTIGLPILNVGLMAIVTLFVLLAGIDFFNLSLDYTYGFVLSGILCLLLLSYIPRWYMYIIQGILAIGLLCVSIYVVPPYYISGISVNGLFFLLFYVLFISHRYTKINIWLALLLSFLLAVFITALGAAIIVFTSHFFDYDSSWVSIILLVGFLVYRFWGIKDIEK